MTIHRALEKKILLDSDCLRGGMLARACVSVLLSSSGVF